MIIRSIHGVKLVNLNWGYQITHDNLVLAAIHDTQGGPHRTEECSAEARKKYELLCGVYERLYRWGKPTQPQLNLLAHIIKGDVTDTYHNYGTVNGNSARALIKRGIIRNATRDPWLGRHYRDYVILDGNFNAIKLY